MRVHWLHGHIVSWHFALLSHCQEYPGERYAQVGSGKAFTGSGIALDDFGLRAGTEFAADSVCRFEYQTIVSGLAGTRLQ